MAIISQLESQIADIDETEAERHERERMEKIMHVFKKILDGIEEKREESLLWLCDFGDEIIDSVHDKAVILERHLETFAENKVSDMEKLQKPLNQALENALAKAKEEIYRQKAYSADAIIEKRKDVMYKIKDLKIELGAAFDDKEKAAKKAKIESHVSELESWIN